jgi:hypothetical protein
MERDKGTRFQKDKKLQGKSWIQKIFPENVIRRSLEEEEKSRSRKRIIWPWNWKEERNNPRDVDDMG